MSECQPITDSERLRTLCSRLADRPALGLDTEFERRNTFFARLALVQIHDGEQAWLLDPLALGGLQPLGDLIRTFTGAVVMHAPLEDFEILQQALGVMPRHVFDTQLAATLTGTGAGLGYDRLVQILFGIAVSKSATRSDWLRRPLSRSQLEYAVADTVHLLPAYERLRARLVELQRLEWLEEEVDRLVSRVHAPEAERDFIRLVRRVADDDHARGMLLGLCRWRETEARRRDLPRRRLAEDNLLVACVKHAPSSVKALVALPDFKLYKRRVNDANLLEAVTQASQAQAVPRPPQAEDLRPLKRQMQRARGALEALAQSLELPTEVLAPKRLMEMLLVTRLVRNEPPPSEFMGWRRHTVLPALLEAMESA